MKKAIMVGIAFLYGPVIHSIPAVESTYMQLKKNPRYRKMSYLEIAIDRGDFEAIRYFELRATLEDLQHTRVLLQNKIAGLEANVKDYKTDFLKQPEKVERLSKVEHERTKTKSYESLLRETVHRIEAAEKELALKNKQDQSENNGNQSVDKTI
jgi:hypothetical protein